MGEAFGTMMGDEFAIDAEAHFIAFGDESEIMPLVVGFPGATDLLGLQQGIEISGNFLFPIKKALSAIADLQIHDAGFVIDEGDARLSKDAVAEMTRVDTRSLTIHKTQLKRFPGIESGKLEADDDTAIGEARLMMDVGGVLGFF